LQAAFFWAVVFAVGGGEDLWRFLVACKLHLHTATEISFSANVRKQT
jgi:hypothetical protein